MKVPLLFYALVAYVAGLLLNEVGSPWWSLVPVLLGWAGWLCLHRLVPLLLALLLALGMFMPNVMDDPAAVTAIVADVPQTSPAATTVCQATTSSLPALSSHPTVTPSQPAATTSRPAALTAWVDARLEQLGADATTRGLAAGMLLGDKTLLERHQRQAFRQAGMSHLMAVSGLHVGLLWLILGWLLSPLRLVHERRLGPWVCSGSTLQRLLLLGLVWVYILAIGSPSSALRAGLMITLVTFNGFMGGRTDAWCCLFAAALGLLLFNPALLWQVGFQLSFLAVAGILAFQPLHGDPRQPRWLRLLVLTLSAQLFTFPVTAYVFHTVPLFGWLQGFLVVPLLPVYLGLLLLGLLLPQYGWLSWPIDLCTAWIRQVAEWTTCLEETLLGGHLTFYPTLLETCFISAVIVGMVLLWRIGRAYSEKSAVER